MTNNGGEEKKKKDERSVLIALCWKQSEKMEQPSDWKGCTAVWDISQLDWGTLEPLVHDAWAEGITCT